MSEMFLRVFERYQDGTVRFAGWGDDGGWCYWSDELQATIGMFASLKQLREFQRIEGKDSNHEW
ncbi:MAG: hypothetical protein DRP45_12080 [Candidatus Zixiibacteriota bacterium]|nr:MAG: hypothetical protein DRP45_12080 [candidate division Zixibacteria bacterium]